MRTPALKTNTRSRFDLVVKLEVVGRAHKKQRGDSYPTRLLRPYKNLDWPDVLGLPALRTLGDAKLDGLAFLQAFEAASLDGRKMYENIFAVLATDETVPLGVVEPLYCSLFHRLCWYSFSEFTLEGVGKNLCRLLAFEARTAHDRFSLTYRLHPTRRPRN
jgi:hypothetical protein